MEERTQPLKVLTIGGSDSGGAAGIQADLKTLTMLGAYGMSVVTVVTAQNSLEVDRLYPIPPELVGRQLDAVLGDYGADGVKTGFTGEVDLIEVIAAKISEYRLANVVVDPVLVNYQGSPMFSDDVTRAYLEHLVPIADMLTPNLREAALLSEMDISNLADVHRAANQLHSLGARWVLITGVREGSKAVDVFFDGKESREFRSSWIDTLNRHGSGDTLSAATCSFLSQGLDVVEAVRRARQYTSEAIEGGSEWNLGSGHGPVSCWGTARQKWGRSPE